jgi:RNA polymerase-binding transcription factor DksA
MNPANDALGVLGGRVASALTRAPAIAQIGTNSRWRRGMDAEQARTRLVAERDRLQQVRAAAGRLTASASEAAERELSSAEQHPAELATETMERELDQSLIDHAELELAEVEAAIKRLDEERFGRCEDCGEPISDGRLEAIPSARFCVEDQAKHSRNGRIRR